VTYRIKREVKNRLTSHPPQTLTTNAHHKRSPQTLTLMPVTLLGISPTNQQELNAWTHGFPSKLVGHPAWWAGALPQYLGPYMTRESPSPHSNPGRASRQAMNPTATHPTATNPTATHPTATHPTATHPTDVIGQERSIQMKIPPPNDKG
jgi:hypothetical protein